MMPRALKRAHLRRCARPSSLRRADSTPHSSGFRAPCIWTLLNALGAESRLRPSWGGIGVGLALVLVLGAAGTALAQSTPDQRLTSEQSEHFVVRFDPERDGILAAPALEALEAGRAAIAAWLGEQAGSRVPVVVAPSVAEFVRLSGLRPEDVEKAGVVGVTGDAGIVVLSPRLLLRGYRWRDTLNHEYVRRLLADLGAGGAPLWLQEGLARLGGTRWRGPDAPFLDDVARSLLARALREGRLIPLEDLGRQLAQLSDPAAVHLAFAECALAVDHLAAKHGPDALRRLVAALGRAPAARGFDEVLQATLGESVASLEEGWRADLAGRGYQELAGLLLPAPRLAGPGAADAWDLADWQPLAAQNHLRLGDLLRGRGNLRAALLEYEKARSVAPGSASVHWKRARALLELGRAGDAVAAAREAQRLGGGYPAASVTLGAALAAAGDAAGAATALRDALELNPFDPYAWRDLGRVLRRLGQAAQAQEASVNALRLRPGDQAFMQSVMEN
jgi:tetratricopeptide (TPR) repeat protein